MAELKDILKKLRSEKNLSQAMLAEMLGAGLSTVASWEVGKRYPSRENIEALADIFNVDINYLYGKTEIRQMQHFDNDGHAMYHLTDFEYQLILKYRVTDSVGKEMVHRALGIETAKEKRA